MRITPDTGASEPTALIHERQVVKECEQKKTELRFRRIPEGREATCQ
jgi:hypothetical protein